MHFLARIVITAEKCSTDENGVDSYAAFQESRQLPQEYEFCLSWQRVDQQLKDHPESVLDFLVFASQFALARRLCTELELSSNMSEASITKCQTVLYLYFTSSS